MEEERNANIDEYLRVNNMLVYVDTDGKAVRLNLIKKKDLPLKKVKRKNKRGRPMSYLKVF